MTPKIPILKPIPPVFDFVRKYFRNNYAIHESKVTKITNR